MGSVSAQVNSTIEINGVNFEIPDEYQDGKVLDKGYRFNNSFSIYCIDDNIPKSLGLWACEKDYEENLTIDNHPVRYYYQYNSYVKNNLSHAYFASGDSFYEISWIGNEISPEIKKIISDSPKSNISSDTFYNVLDESVDIYYEMRKEQLNQDSEYNYLQSRYSYSKDQRFDDDEIINWLYMYDSTKDY